MLRHDLHNWWQRRSDWLIGAALALLTLALYVATLLPGLGIGDTAEFQRVVPLLKLAHPTGYPLYTLLGWLWAHLPLGGTPAWRMNLFSATAAALAIGALYAVARALGQTCAVAAAAALTFAVSRTFWSQATIAEVYALAALLQALLLLALLHWQRGAWPFWVVGLTLGLGLAHHRTIVLMLPGALAFLALTRRPALKQIGVALLLALGCGLLYVYVLLRAPVWRNPWEVLGEYLSGSSVAAAWLNIPHLLQDGLARPLDLGQHFVWPELLPVGVLLAVLGGMRLVARSRAHAALLLGSAATIFVFCSAYYVVDLTVFFIPLFLVAALLIGEGAMLLLDLLASRAARPAGVLFLAVPALLLQHNLAAIRAANTPQAEHDARARMRQLPAQPAVVIGAWQEIEGMRYLQEIEGQRPDIEFDLVADRQYVLDALAGGRAVYLMEPDAHLGLAQWPEGRLWRVSAQRLAATTRTQITWADGIELVGYAMDSGPYQPGQVVALTLDWRARTTPQRSYTLFVHLVSADEKIWAQHDHAPSTAPTGQWQPGTQVLDIYGLTLDPATPPGRYHVNVGWYDPMTMQRLLLADAPGDYATLGEIEVAAAEGTGDR